MLLTPQFFLLLNASGLGYNARPRSEIQLKFSLTTSLYRIFAGEREILEHPSYIKQVVFKAHPRLRGQLYVKISGGMPGPPTRCMKSW